MQIKAKTFCQHLSVEYSIRTLPNQMKMNPVAFKFKHKMSNKRYIYKWNQRAKYTTNIPKTKRLQFYNNCVWAKTQTN